MRSQIVVLAAVLIGIAVQSTLSAGQAADQARATLIARAKSYELNTPYAPRPATRWCTMPQALPR